MPGMPYHLEKGGWLSVLEDYLNGAPGRSAVVLELLRNPKVPVSDTGFLQSPALDKDPDYETEFKRVRHLRTDWFGWVGDGAMPEDLKGKYQYFTEARMDRLRQLGFNHLATELEDGVGRYVRQLMAESPLEPQNRA